MFGGKRSKPVKVFKIIVGTRATRTCPLEHIDSIARDAGGVLSPDHRECDRPFRQTYLFPSERTRKQFKRILQGRYPSDVEMLFVR